MPRHGEPLVVSCSKLYKAPEPLTPEEVTQRLYQEQSSHTGNAGLGVSHHDIVRLASNAPSEDELVHAILRDPVGTGNDWLA